MLPLESSAREGRIATLGLLERLMGAEKVMPPLIERLNMTLALFVDANHTTLMLPRVSTAINCSPAKCELAELLESFCGGVKSNCAWTTGAIMAMATIRPRNTARFLALSTRVLN